MWVVNNTKERVRIYLRSDIKSSITNLTDADNKVHNAIAAINRATAGTASGVDRQMIDDCRKAMQQLSEARQNLYVCLNYVEQLETREQIEDE